jgi:hypothetical protein
MDGYSLNNILSRVHSTFSNGLFMFLRPFGEDGRTRKINDRIVILNRLLPGAFLGWITLQIGNPPRNLS